ncbi:MAG: hypothetical protein H6619_05080 [Deltaproteobacteria bacterium]|nr:hypothetical protein [Deltaproteobacteria bacterium]
MGELSPQATVGVITQSASKNVPRGTSTPEMEHHSLKNVPRGTSMLKTNGTREKLH